jgi:uncharacterized surface protein with fasciclin (FAS1) repeats
MPKSLLDVLDQAGTFGTLMTAIKQAKLDETLRQAGPYTLFAPTQAAIAALPDRQFDSWLFDDAKLTKVVKFHVVAGRLSAADLLDRHFLKTLEGQRLRITSRLDDVGYAETDATDAYGYIMGGTVTVAIALTIKVNGATTVQADLAADNGFVHVIDHVLVPWPLNVAR